MRRVVAGAVVIALVALTPAAHATNDPFWNQQYGPKQIYASEAWAKSRGAGVRIAVIDSGMDLQHPDLTPRLVPGCPGSECYDFGSGDDNPDDDSSYTYTDSTGKTVAAKGHGTLVSGVAAAATDNGVGVAGVAPDAQLMPLKVLGNSGSTTGVLTHIPNAVNFAVDHGAKVLNLSLGDFNLAGMVGPIQTACNTAFTRGALCIVASGNSGATQPSGYDRSFNAVVVTANDEQGKHAAFGQKADTQWALSAPGVGIVSTHPVEMGSYAKASGTSLSAPHVAGAAALLFAQGLSNRAVADRLKATAKDMGDPGVNGAGLLNAAAAVGAPIGTTPSGGSSGGSSAGGGGTRAPGSTAGGTVPVAGAETPTTVAATSTDTSVTVLGEEPGEPVPLDLGLGNNEGDEGDDTEAVAAAVAALLLLGVAGATAFRLRAPWAARARAR